MDKTIEDKFINNFIVKNRRERLSFELNSKKRMNALSRFCHNSEHLLIMDKVICSGKKIYEDDLIEIIKTNCRDKNCYIMAFDESMDGIVCDYKEALNKVLGNGMAAIIIFDNLVIVETEQCYGNPWRYVLAL